MTLTMNLDERGIATFTFDRDDGKPNMLTEAVVVELERLIREAADADDLRGILITATPETGFIAGADVNAIAEMFSREKVLEVCEIAQRTFGQLRNFPVPVVAAINGVCLGGGLELALACKYRLVADDRSIQLGLPETQLGIIPGFGGSVRLPRLIGFQRAIELVTSARRLMPQQALKMGVVDEVVPPELLISRARQVIEDWQSPRIRTHLTKRVQPRNWRERLLESPPGRAVVRQIAKRAVHKETEGHYPAPLRAIDVMYATLGQLDESAYVTEREAVADLLTTDPPHSPARHLLAIYQMRERHRRAYPGRTDAQTEAGKQATLPQHVGIIGAGLMGGGLAQLFAYHKARVRLKDVHPEALSIAMRTADELTRPLVKRRKLTQPEGMALMDRLSPTLDYTGFKHCDFAVEAVVERMEVKQQVFAELEAVVPEDCILATNTSSLSITQIAEATQKPERVVGLHFFSPVHKMPLVEIIPGERTSEEALERTFQVATKLGKIPILCKDSPAFLVNRVLGAYLNEAAWLVREGMSPTQVDSIMRRFGMPVGPCQLIDEVGLPVAGEVVVILRERWPENFPAGTVLQRMLDRGLHGKRSDKGGFYTKRKIAGVWPRRTVNPAFRELVKGLRQEVLPKGHHAPSAEQAQTRMVYAMINEAARALADEVVASPSDVDAGMIFGTGFPAFRGGVMVYARDLGRETVIDTLKKLRDRHGKRFEPCEDGLPTRDAAYSWAKPGLAAERPAPVGS